MKVVNLSLLGLGIWVRGAMSSSWVSHFICIYVLLSALCSFYKGLGLFVFSLFTWRVNVGVW